ncbi:MAG: hypothetical protein R2762_01530 [Bryobacteraceae bacterium]
MHNLDLRFRARLLFASCLLAFASYAKAAPCVFDSLDSYVALGAGGCSIGPAQFTDFTLLPVSFTGIDPAAVLIMPGMAPGFLVTLGATAATGETLQSTFSFLASGAAFNSATVALIGSVVDFDGANTGVATFTPGPTIIAFDIGVDAQLSDMAALGGVPSVLTELDFVIDGGTFGSASLNQGSIAFGTSAVPEPATALLMLPALLLLAVRMKRRQISLLVRNSNH